MAEFSLSIVAPDRTVYEQDVVSLTVPGIEGYMGILAGHEPIIAALETGVVECRDGKGQTTHIAITGGFLEVSDGKAIILADGGERARDIDVSSAERELEEARRALRGENSEMSSEQASHVIRVAMNRIKAARKA